MCQFSTNAWKISPWDLDRGFIGVFYFSVSDKQPKLKVTLASDNEGWDIAVNGQLILELAANPRVKLSGLLPKGITEKQNKDAKKLGIELFEAKDIPVLLPSDTLAFPPDSLEIDVVIFHSYGRYLGRQAQIVRERKSCKWLHVIHTVCEELAKFSDTPAELITEHEVQIELSKIADVVIGVGPKVTAAYRSALQPSGKDKDVIDLTPGIFYNLISTRPTKEEGEKFHVLMSGSLKYFKVKGCDIAAKAIKLLNSASYKYHLTFIVKPKENVAEITEALQNEGIDSNHFTVEVSNGAEDWSSLLCKVDLLIKPSRAEGFGVSGVRAISADLPLLASNYCGLGVALQKLPSGNKHVVESEDPQVWADKIREVKEKGSKINQLEAEELRSEYEKQFNWKEQCDKLVTQMLSLISEK